MNPRRRRSASASSSVVSVISQLEPNVSNHKTASSVISANSEQPESAVTNDEWLIDPLEYSPSSKQLLGGFASGSSGSLIFERLRENTNSTKSLRDSDIVFIDSAASFNNSTPLFPSKSPVRIGGIRDKLSFSLRHNNPVQQHQLTIPANNSEVSTSVANYFVIQYNNKLLNYSNVIK